MVGNPLFWHSQIQRVVNESLGVGAQIKTDGKGRFRANASTRNVEAQLANANGHAVDAEVTKAQDAGTIGDDANASFLPARPVPEDAADSSLVRD